MVLVRGITGDKRTVTQASAVDRHYDGDGKPSRMEPDVVAQRGQDIINAVKSDCRLTIHLAKP